MPDLTTRPIYDTVIIGGGSAGVCAAAQSARAGASTLLVEKSGMLGGTTTLGGVNFPGLFHAWGRQIIAGIGWEIVTRCVQETGGALPDFSAAPEHHWQQQVWVDRALYPALCDETVLESGAALLLHTMIADVERAGDDWRVFLCTKAGLSMVTARVLVDCTGDANAVALAGYDLRIPHDPQPASLVCAASGYDLEALDIPAINDAFEQQVRLGNLSYTDVSWCTDRADVGTWLRKHGGTANHIHHINARTSEERTTLEIEARRAVRRVYRFLRAQPGLERLTIDYLAPECGVRETATIVGQQTITAQDYATGRLWEDALCYAYYPIDLHTSDMGGLDCRQLAEGVVPTVPRGAMLPRRSRNLVVAGRCISSDRLANSALRVQATCMATGQAAGAMAALTAQTGIEVAELPIPQIHHLLRSHGAIVSHVPE